MSSETETRRRTHWWVVGGGPLGAIVFTTAMALLTVSNVFNVLDDAQWWDWGLLAVAIVLVLSGAASIVFYARHPEAAVRR